MTIQPLQPLGQASDDGLFPIVGIGASAGGLEAFSQLLHHLPCDTGMAFVLVQHLDPKHESRLGPLLAKATSMPVLEATEGLAVLPDHIYIIPPDTTLTVAEGILHLTPRGVTRGLHLPIDRFFKSLSADRRTGAIGVVLSGSGSDGTLGLEEIKSEGGITFAQDEPSAKYPGMPRSAKRGGSVDFVLTPESIAVELVRIGRHAYLAPGMDGNGPGEEDLFKRVLRLLRDATGVDFQEYRETTIRRRILRRMALHTRQELADYVRVLEEDSSEVDALFEDILINVTRFFREPEAFEELKRTVFPEILKGRTSATPVRIWVPGCSTGQEAYSLAMALLEHLEDSSSRIPVQIFATDLSDAVSLRKAREGCYPESIEAEVTPERLQRFFTKEDGHYRISKAIRDLCVFARQDVAADPPFSRMDLISCRNLLIYLAPRLQKRVIPTFHYALSPGGFLLLGSAETIGPFSDLFGVVDPRHRIYVKTGVLSRQYPHFQSGEAGVSAKIPLHTGLSTLQIAAGRLLRMPAAEPAVKNGVRVLPVDLPGNTERCFLVVLDEARPPAAAAASVPARRRRWPWRWLRSDDLPTVQLRQELSSTRESLQGVIEQQDVANEELRSAIEEALSANEELQSTNEELETAKEELQSVNEELTTVNEQLQNRNAELREDVTERVRLENDLRESADRLSEADRRKDEFLATLAHELRNPLAPLRNALEILRLAEGPEQAVRARELMERQVRQMTRLIDDLLDVSRINLGRIELRRERIELSAAVSQAVEASSPSLVAAGHEISVLLPPEALVLEADPLRLAQILENLLGNAVRYTEPGGRIRLAVSREEDQAVLRISDSGIGIAADKLREIWEPFVQVDPSFERSRSGLGIGLTLVRKLVQLHGGSVEAQSAGLGQGSEFIVRLPLIEDRRGKGAVPTPPPPEPSVPAPLRILVVDDNVDQAESFGMLLRLMGHEVLVVHGGPAALAAAASFRPVLGLLDIGMPGLSGYELARQLRQEPGLDQTVLVAVSGYGTDEDRRRSKEAGFHAHWIKPVDLDVLRALLLQLAPSC